MYGAAGWTHTPGFAKCGTKYKPPRIVRGERDKKETKPKFDKANQANARRLGVR